MSETIDWILCIICQETTTEELCCPIHDPLAVYNAFIKNVEEFKKINSLPIEIDFREGGSTLLQNHAKWHKQCHQKFNNTKLERAKLKRQREGEKIEDVCPPKRRSIERSNAPGRNKELCLFCESICPEPLHEFTTFNSNKSVNEMATAMGDRDLLVKLSEGDLVAIEAKYHFSFLSKYRN